MKTCSDCGGERPESEFSRKGEGLQSMCKPCFREYRRGYYARNKSLYVAKNRRNKARPLPRLRAILSEEKGQPCQDCGGSFHPWVMELDHRESETKSAAVGDLVSKGCLDERLIAEIAKCDVVSANCHRMRTFNRLRRGSV